MGWPAHALIRRAIRGDLPKLDQLGHFRKLFGRIVYELYAADEHWNARKRDVEHHARRDVNVAHRKL